MMDQQIILLILAGIVLIGIVFYAATRGRLVHDDKKNTEKPEESSGPNQKTTESLDLNAIATKLEPLFEKMAHPGDTLQDADFQHAVTALSSDAYSATQVRNYALGSNWVLQCIGLEALARRNDSDDILERVRTRFSSIWGWPLYFAVRFVDSKSSDPEIGNILLGAQYWWPDNAMICEEIGAIFKRRLAEGERVALGSHYDALDSDDRANVSKFVSALPADARQPIEAALKQHAKDAIDQTFLRSVGELLVEKRLRDPVFATKQISGLLDELNAEITDDKPTSILIVGESGVGKSALRRLFARKLLDAGWRVFKTSATNMIADKKYIGEIEGQIRKLSKNASVAKRVAVYVDRLSELDEFGRHKNKDTSILDQLWPMLESHDMFFVSESTPAGLQAMLKRFPTLPTTMKILKMEPASESATAEMANSFLDLINMDTSQAQKDEVIAEALQLSQQYLTHKALPGSLLSLVELAVIRSQRSEDERPLNRTHVLRALSQISGLPKDVLDERQKLDVAAIRDAFNRRIIGQEEAVECLVERIAMLKAGLTDPSRPVGVFLFAGPTGTGKTELAKTLAELLFGSPDQMIRLDMSEFQNSDAAWRLIGEDGNRGNTGSLTTRIREQPFSVVLLDEFEKAHVKVWDMFLQVFDDGRLTDIEGGLADFRHSIIILTSNLGSTISNEAGVGFTSKGGEFSSDDVTRTVNRTFRREFVNRLDRVVVFKPLGRDVMRAILQKELRLTLGRRGLRTKQWAVEWEDSAVEFLLDEGFTPDLGARPLRRAIEKHLLAPLSITMVQNETPAGEQFLFIRSNGESLQVEFIDPDADETDDSTLDTLDASAEMTIEKILQSTSVPEGAPRLLAEEMTAIQEQVASEDWENRKAKLIAKMNSSDFWEKDDRYAVMDRIELMDRIDSAASVLGALAGRLERSGNNSKLVKGIANRIFVLREGLKDFFGRRSTQAIIGIRLVTSDANLDGAQAFRDRLILMYRNWARARGMRLRELDSGECRYEALFVISGFGSFGLLEAESGLHVFEVPLHGTQFERIRVRVQVEQVPVDGEQTKLDTGKAAAELLDADKSRKVVIVRRYRKEPSPLARDSVRKWRSGRLGFIFDGNFDVLGES